MRKWRYELDTRVLSLFFLVAMPFVAFGSFIVVRMARSALQDSLGARVEQQALQTKLLVERYIANEVVRLRLLGLEPDVRAAASRSAKETSPEETKRLEQAWAAGDARLNEQLVASPLAARLRDLLAVDPGLRLVQVVDARGRLVATSGRAGRISSSETAWFKGVASDEAGRLWVSDIQRAASGAAFLEIAFPVRDPGDGRWLGALRAVLDPTDLYSVLAPVRMGKTGHAQLIRATDGMVLASDDSGRILKEKFPGFQFLQAAKQERRGFWVVPELKETTTSPEGATVAIEPARIVGWSPVDQVPNVQWLVTVEQDLAEALAPINGVTGFLWIHFIGVFATVILLAVYFSFKLEKPVIQEDLHLHEEHVPSGVKPTES